MDWLNDMRVIVTVASFGAFVGIVLWAFTPALRRRFDADAEIPFLDDETPTGPQTRQAAKTPEQ